MPTPTNQTPSNLPRMSGATGYGLGFFCGFVVAAVGTYLSVTDHGKELKHKIIKEFKQHQQAIILESVLPSDESTKESSLVKTSRNLIAKLRQLISFEKVTKPTLKTSHQDLSIKKKHYFKKK